MHKRKCAEGEGTPGEWAASGSVQGAGRVCRRQGQGSMYRGSMPRHTARRATGRGVRANGHGVGRWYVQGVCTVCTERMKSQYIIYRRGNARDENGATAGVLGKGVGAPMSDAGARRSVGRQRAWLRVTGCAERPPPAITARSTWRIVPGCFLLGGAVTLPRGCCCCSLPTEEAIRLRRLPSHAHGRNSPAGWNNYVPDPQAGPATMSDHDPSAPIEGTGAWSDAHGTHAARTTHARRAALRERVDTSTFNAVIAPT